MPPQPLPSRLPLPHCLPLPLATPRQLHPPHKQLSPAPSREAPSSAPRPVPASHGPLARQVRLISTSRSHRPPAVMHSAIRTCPSMRILTQPSRLPLPQCLPVQLPIPRQLQPFQEHPTP